MTHEPAHESSSTVGVPGLVSILIINWNGLRFHEECLRSIRERVTVPHEVIFLDNGSHDGSVAYVEAEFPEVKVVRMGENLGFTRGNNAAAQHASGEFYLLLNNDTILRTDIAPAVQLLQAEASVGAVGASMYSAAGKRLPNCGSFPSLPRLMLLKSMFWRPYRGAYGPSEFGAQRVGWVEGSWLLTRASGWTAVGGFDGRLFMYGEDLHYCRDLSDLGLVSVHMPSLRYTHFVGFSTKRQPYMYAHLRHFHSKHSGPLRRRAADLIMKLGLQLRVVAYAVLGAVLRNETFRERRNDMQRALDVWDQTATPGVRFH